MKGMKGRRLFDSLTLWLPSTTAGKQIWLAIFNPRLVARGECEPMSTLAEVVNTDNGVHVSAPKCSISNDNTTVVICIVGAVTLELRWVHATVLSWKPRDDTTSSVQWVRKYCIVQYFYPGQTETRTSLAAYIQRAGLEVSTHHWLQNPLVTLSPAFFWWWHHDTRITVNCRTMLFL